MKTTKSKKAPARYAVIMAGGRGERFWPVGRRARPKQFIDFFGGKPLIAHAIERLATIVPPERIMVLTASDLVRATRNALPELPAENVIGEPIGRDTAAACAVATAWAAWKGGNNASLCILSADQLVGDKPAFRKILRTAFEAVEDTPVLSTIGIKPDAPATGYGYIELGAPLRGHPGVLAVKRFVEKPDPDTAAAYVKGGRHVWNGGMFVWRASTALDAFRAHRPVLADLADTIRGAFGTRSFNATFKKLYEPLEKISVDYALMEKASNIVVVPGAFEWDDVGAWPSAAQHLPQDADKNARLGNVELQAARGNAVVNTQDGHVVAVLGTDDLVVVHTPDATLVCTKAAAAGLKNLVANIGKNHGAQYL